jgi:hypothetical protein
MDPVPLSRIILYVRDIGEVAAFYQTHFSLQPLPGAEDGWLELGAPRGGRRIALRQAATSQKRGSEIKIVFAVKDVARFVAQRTAAGLKFGVIQRDRKSRIRQRARSRGKFDPGFEPRVQMRRRRPFLTSSLRAQRSNPGPQTRDCIASLSSQ